VVSWAGILLGAGVAGVGVLALRARARAAAAPQQPPSTSSTACELAAKAAAAAGLPFSADACAGILGTVGAIGEAVFYSADDQARDIAAAATKNDQLNGEIAIPMDPYVTRFVSGKGNPAIYGNALRYANGCEPFKGAPGWSKCAPGTRSLFGPASFRGSELGVVALAPAQQPGKPDRGVEVDAGDNGGQRMLTGSLDPKNPDPATRGPFRNSAGGNDYLIRGRRMTCPAGEAPALWDADGNPVRDQRELRCAPGGVSSWQASTSAPPATVPGETDRTALGCIGDQPPAGYTWVAATSTTPGHWERLQAGQTPNPGPCATSSTSSGSRFSGTLAVGLNGGFATLT
jgi:hypothetical protein